MWVSSRRATTYRCNNSRLRICDFGHQLSERKIEKYLLENIHRKLEEYIIDSEVSQKMRQSKPKIHDLVSLNEKLRRLNVIFIAGNISDEEYAKETARLKTEIEKAKQAEQEEKPVNLEKLRDFCKSDYLSTYDSLNKEDQRRFWRSLIEEIYVEGTSVTGVKLRV